MSPPLLQVNDLKKHFPVKKGLFSRKSEWVYAVDGVSFEIARGETLSLVGESGCGKSTVGRAILRLFDITAGQVPDLRKPIVGCVFAGRCALATDLCRQYAPGLEEKGPRHVAACHYAAKGAVAA